MIRLAKDNVVMEVSSELQASVFEKNGYVRVTEAKAVEPAPVEEEPKQEEPQKRLRKRRA